MNGEKKKRGEREREREHEIYKRGVTKSARGGREGASEGGKKMGS